MLVMNILLAGRSSSDLSSFPSAGLKSDLNGASLSEMCPPVPREISSPREMISSAVTTFTAFLDAEGERCAHRPPRSCRVWTGEGPILSTDRARGGGLIHQALLRHGQL